MSLTHYLNDLLHATFYYQFSDIILNSGSEALDTVKHVLLEIPFSFYFHFTIFSQCFFKFDLDSIPVSVTDYFSFINSLNVSVLQVSAANLCLFSFYILLSHPHISFQTMVSTTT